MVLTTTNSIAVNINSTQSNATKILYDKAKTLYIEVLKKNPQNWDAYLELAKVCAGLKDSLAAEGYLITLKEKNPSFKPEEVDALMLKLK